MIFSIAKRPALGLVLGFIAAISIGTLMLMLPAATPADCPISFVDAIFTATSATCVTGLIVRSTPLGFTAFGKSIILILIQLGGLGIMTFSISLFLTFGRKISKSQEILLKDALNEDNIRSAKKLLNFLLLFTFGTELVGSVLLFFGFRNYFPFLTSVKMAIFHSVSAFCNAGFSLLDTSLTQFAKNPFILLVFSALIILGGIGFVVLLDFLGFFTKERRHFKLHTKITVAATIFLLTAGTILFYGLEKNNTLKELGNSNKWVNSFFLSVTSRTAGFNTVDTSKTTSSSKLLISSLMFIGASPGGTGGGIKTMTFIIILLLALSHIKYREDLTIYKRNIPAFFARRAVAICVYAVILLFIASGILLFTETFPPENIVFEVISAFGTVGLSTGITPALSNFSKFVLIVVMFMGRLGPMTIALAAVGRKANLKISYANERILLG